MLFLLEVTLHISKTTLRWINRSSQVYHFTKYTIDSLLLSILSTKTQFCRSYQFFFATPALHRCCCCFLTVITTCLSIDA
ncbi:hypothetical protein L6452_14964 [Arctium lappa]|uniref:Uncharacterized protein n=1 Tax=Arctium lappa TaxID=4217 RepID=A0ACB9CMH2_ARCLA|nr:hypothetical protein L6452_14964 [Arctium lappa]